MPSHPLITIARPLATAIVALGLGLQAPLAADSARSNQYLEDALDRLQQSDPLAALIQLRNALKEDPDNIRAQRLLGELYLNQGRYVDAEKALRRAHDAEPSAQGALQLARALLGVGQAEEALDLLRNAGEVKDEALSTDLALAEAQALLGLRRADEARALVAPIVAANPLNAQAGLLDAQISLQEGDDDSAKGRIARTLEVDDSSLQAWLLKAQISTSEGRYGDALAELQKADELAPGTPQIKVMRAEALIRQAKFDEAEQELQAVFAIAPDDVAANFLLATIQSGRGQLREADATLRKIADRAREVNEVVLLSGVVKLGIGQAAQAEALLEQYLANVPNNLPVRRMLAGLQLQEDSPRAAADTLAPVVGPESTDLISLQLMSTAEIRMGEVEAARATLNRIAQLGQQPSAQQAGTLLAVLDENNPAIQDADARLEIARILDMVRNGQGEAALAAGEKLAADYPKIPAAINVFGMTQLVNGASGLNAARDLFEQAIALDPSYLDAHRNLDRLDVRDARWSVLEERLRKRIEQDLDAEGSTITLARLLLSRERKSDALDVLRQQATKAPDSAMLRQVLLQLAVQGGDAKEAGRLAGELMAIGDRGQALGYSAAGDYHFAQGDYDAAVDAYTKLSAAEPENTALMVFLAQAQYRAEKPEAARATLERIRAQQPANQVANNSLVDLDLLAGRHDAALAFTEKLKTVAPDQAARLKSKVLMAENKPEEALSTLARSLAGNPSPMIARELFLLRHQLGRQDEAIAGLRSWLATNPDDVGALDMLGDAYVERQELETALGYFERAHQLTLNDPVLLNDLSWVRYELGRPGAVDLARRAYQMRPLPAIGDTLGWILVKEGRVEEGLALLREAHQGLQDNPDIRYHLAYALERKGETEEALGLLEGLASWPNPFHEQDRALELLRKLKQS
jgi:putative PEP-CTERM system TPR-repeat lipoprotein